MATIKVDITVLKTLLDDLRAYGNEQIWLGYSDESHVFQRVRYFQALLLWRAGLLQKIGSTGDLFRLSERGEVFVDRVLDDKVWNFIVRTASQNGDITIEQLEHALLYCRYSARTVNGGV